MSLSDRIADRQPAPARDGHFHQACQHWCFRYGCTNSACGTCTTKAANDRMQAAYQARNKRSA